MARSQHELGLWETFCIYCQLEFSRPDLLRRHVLRVHPGSYRAAEYLHGERKTAHGG
jgi:hypothetical protein